MIVTQKIVLDFKRNAMPPILPAVQGDAGSRSLDAYLLSGGVPWAIPEGVVAFVAYRHADSTSGIYDTLPDGSAACIPAGNVLTIHMVPEICAVPGITQVAVTLIKGETQLSTFRFSLCVEGDLGGGQYPSQYINLETWLAGHQVVGATGKSAYEEAVSLGYKGTNAEWLANLRGATFTPSIKDGYLVWENDKNLPNPDPLFIDQSALDVKKDLDQLKRLQFENTVVPTGAFVAHGEYADHGYPYRASIPLAGVKASMLPDVTYSIPDAVSGDFAPGGENLRWGSVHLCSIHPGICGYNPDNCLLEGGELI